MGSIWLPSDDYLARDILGWPRSANEQPHVDFEPNPGSTLWQRRSSMYNAFSFDSTHGDRLLAGGDAVGSYAGAVLTPRGLFTNAGSVTGSLTTFGDSPDYSIVVAFTADSAPGTSGYAVITSDNVNGESFQITWNHVSASFQSAFALKVGGTWHSVPFYGVAGRNVVVASMNGTTRQMGVACNGRFYDKYPTYVDNITTASGWMIGEHVSAGDDFQGSVQFLSILKHAFTQGECQRISRDFYNSEFLPANDAPSQIRVPEGGGAPTLSSPGVINVLSDRATPQVTITF